MSRRIRKERFLNRAIRSPFSYVVLIGLFFTFTYSAISTHQKSRIAKEKTHEVESELFRLKEQEESLQASLHDMNTPFGIEKSLREKFGIIKEGERAVIVVEPEIEEIPEMEQKEGGFFKFLRDVF